MAAAGENQKILRKRLSMQTIGPDKINQLRHARFFKNVKGVEVHMQKHAEILRPKFERAIEIFSKELADTGTAFTKPKGGYFISVETPRGCAKRVRQLCKDAGVLLTEAGATFPYANDPADTNLRFAPTFLSMEELEQALEVFCIAVKLAAEEKG
jgi:DNA-binding transcriptional MocR family regulator